LLRRLAAFQNKTLRLLVGVWFQVLFTPRQGFFSPFPHGTGSLSVSSEYLALDGGPPRFPQSSTCSEVLGKPFQGDSSLFAYGAVTLCGPPFQTGSAKWEFCNSPSPLHRTPNGPHDPTAATGAAFNTAVV